MWACLWSKITDGLAWKDGGFNDANGIQWMCRTNITNVSVCVWFLPGFWGVWRPANRSVQIWRCGRIYWIVGVDMCRHLSYTLRRLVSFSDLARSHLIWLTSTPVFGNSLQDVFWQHIHRSCWSPLCGPRKAAQWSETWRWKPCNFGLTRVPFGTHFAFLSLFGILHANCCRKRCKDDQIGPKPSMYTPHLVFILCRSLIVFPKLVTCRSAPAAHSFTATVFGQT